MCVNFCGLLNDKDEKNQTFKNNIKRLKIEHRYPINQNFLGKIFY